MTEKFKKSAVANAIVIAPFITGSEVEGGAVVPVKSSSCYVP